MYKGELDDVEAVPRNPLAALPVKVGAATAAMDQALRLQTVHSASLYEVQGAHKFGACGNHLLFTSPGSSWPR